MTNYSVPVGCERVGKSVERAHLLAWFVQALTALWYAAAGRDGPRSRDRPWYTDEKAPHVRGHARHVAAPIRGMLFPKEAADGHHLSKFQNALNNWLAAVR